MDGEHTKWRILTAEIQSPDSLLLSVHENTLVKQTLLSFYFFAECTRKTHKIYCHLLLATYMFCISILVTCHICYLTAPSLWKRENVIGKHYVSQITTFSVANQLCIKIIFRAANAAHLQVSTLQTPTFEWHRDSREFDSGGILLAKWCLAWLSHSPNSECWVQGGTPNDRDKLKRHPAILLLTSIDAIKQENGAWRPLRDYSADFTWFPPALNLSLFGFVCHAFTNHGI